LSRVVRFHWCGSRVCVCFSLFRRFPLFLLWLMRRWQVSVGHCYGPAGFVRAVVLPLVLGVASLAHWTVPVCGQSGSVHLVSRRSSVKMMTRKRCRRKPTELLVRSRFLKTTRRSHHLPIMRRIGPPVQWGGVPESFRIFFFFFFLKWTGSVLHVSFHLLSVTTLTC
jgi:hypothetical protein